MASTTLTPHGHRTGGGRTGQNTALRMSTSTKIIVGIVIVVVMALTSFWGVYAPSFSEAYILPVQMTAADGTPLGDFRAVLYPGKTERRSWSSGMRISCARLRAAWCIPKSSFPTKARRSLKESSPAPWRPLKFPQAAFLPPSGNSGITEDAPGKPACYGIVTERAQVSLYNR